jgi:hypothetical protein
MTPPNEPVELPSKALPDFFRAMQKRSKPASGPYSFIPDKSLYMASDGASFVLRIHAAGALRNYTFRGRFVEAGKTQRLEWDVRAQMKPLWILVFGAVLIGAGSVVGILTQAFESRYMFAWVGIMAAVFYANYRTMLRARSVVIERCLREVKEAIAEVGK